MLWSFGKTASKTVADTASNLKHTVEEQVSTLKSQKIVIRLFILFPEPYDKSCAVLA